MANKTIHARPFLALAGLCSGLFAAACNGEPETRNLLDAAEIYADHETVFESIRGAHPGPYKDFSRLPPRNPAEETKEGRGFVKALRKQIPVEYLDFFPIGDTGGDELDVVLKRFSHGDQWHTVSVIYFSSPLVLSKEYPNIRLFETCDERSLKWLNSKHDPGPYAVFCRLNESWYAYQRVD